jgi:tetratricopeptide (TPR) repeat protein
MTRKPRAKADPLEGEIELTLHPGAFIPDRACFSFVADLDGVAAKIAKLTAADPARAISLYETFLAGCYEKAEELDDSSGSFGQFIGELFCGWIEARQAAGADPEETATRLLAWMDDDPYGFCHHIEMNAARVFGKAGLAAFEKQIRARFDAAASAKPAPEGAFRDRTEYLRRRWGEVLRTLYLEQKNAAAYVALAEETGPTAQDCRNVATLLASRRKPEEALAWVERGLNLDKKTPHRSMAGYDLGKLKRDLLTRLGRGDEALEAAWAEYREHPSKYTYDDLMKFVPKAERSTWHEKAMDAGQGADLDSLIELLLETQETERFAELVRRTTDEALEQVSHYTAEPAAKKLEKPHPDLAARLWRAQGMRIVNAKKSKLYDAALSHFERAMRCYQKAGLAAEWEKTVSRVRAEHHRKTGFMPGFEDLVAGSAPSDLPSFLERAKARWGKRLVEEDR